MAFTSARQIQREHQRGEVMRLALERRTAIEIAAILDIPDRTVRRHLGEIRDRVAARADAAYEVVLAEQLAELDAVLGAAWQAWARSTQPQTETRRSETPAPPAPESGGADTAEAPDSEALTPVRHPAVGDPVAGLRSELRVSLATTTRTSAGDPRFLDLVLRAVDLKMRVVLNREQRRDLARREGSGTGAPQIPLAWLRERDANVQEIDAALLRLRSGDIEAED